MVSYPNDQGQAAGAIPVYIAGNSGEEPIGYLQQTLSGTAAGFSSIPSGATSALVVLETAAARWRNDGTAPTASVGMPMAVATPTSFAGAANLAALEFIAQTGSPVMNVTFYK